jgi:hypothetical protein
MGEAINGAQGCFQRYHFCILIKPVCRPNRLLDRFIYMHYMKPLYYQSFSNLSSVSATANTSIIQLISPRAIF